jgi:hypothetical protein
MVTVNFNNSPSDYAEHTDAMRRAIVRNGNLDADGNPIDANAGPPIAPPIEPRGTINDSWLH